MVPFYGTFYNYNWCYYWNSNYNYYNYYVFWNYNDYYNYCYNSYLAANNFGYGPYNHHVPLYGRLIAEDQLLNNIPQHIRAMQTRIPLRFRDRRDRPLRKLSMDLIETYNHINDVSIF